MRATPSETMFYFADLVGLYILVQEINKFTNDNSDIFIHNII